MPSPPFDVAPIFHTPQMFSKVILFLALASGAAAAPASSGDAILDSNSTRAVKYAWESFKSEFRREYGSEKEESLRFKHFEATLKLIEERNAAERHNGGSAQHGITRFADLSQEEFQARYLKTVMPEKFEKKNLVNLQPPTSTKAADWTGTYTTPVKDQGYCGSCWAFSVTEQIESDSMRQLKTDYIMAPQQLVSCDTGDYGCNGGWPTTAYDYVESYGGLVSEEDYPYTSGTAGVTGTCDTSLDSMTKLITVDNYYTLATEVRFFFFFFFLIFFSHGGRKGDLSYRFARL